jgi:hypothetical protein
MHPYLITAAPNRWQRAVRWSRRAAVTGMVLAAHLALGLVVLTLRTALVVVTICATLAGWLEMYLAQRTGRPPFGQVAGMGVAAAFTDEFRTARTRYAHDYATTEGGIPL